MMIKSQGNLKTNNTCLNGSAEKNIIIKDDKNKFYKKEKYIVHLMIKRGIYHYVAQY